MGLKIIETHLLAVSEGEGFTILEDAEVSFASKGDSKLSMRLRRVRLKQHEGGGMLDLLTTISSVRRSRSPLFTKAAGRSSSCSDGSNSI